MSNQDNFHRVYTITPVHLPQVNNTCDSLSVEQCTLLTVTVTENLYEYDPLDTGKYPQAASEMRCKLSSRQRIQHDINANNQDFHSLDEIGNRCADIN